MFALLQHGCAPHQAAMAEVRGDYGAIILSESREECGCVMPVARPLMLRDWPVSD